MSTVLDFTSGLITVNNGESVATITNATSEFFDRGTALFAMGGSGLLLPASVTQGASTNEVILLRSWDQGNLVDAPFVAFNTIEGLVSALRLARENANTIEVIDNNVRDILQNLDTLLTSTDEIIEIGGINVTPWGYMKDKFETESSDLLTEFEDDLKRNRLLALAGIVL